MRRMRFRDPAGAVRVGTLEDEGTVEAAGRSFEVEEVAVLPPVEPSKIVGVGLNYADHAAEMSAEPPDRPRLFLMPPTAVAGHGDVVALPADAGRVEHEAELAVVIGEQCRHVPVEDAEEVIAGYTCLNDISDRDQQARERNYVRAKGFDGAAPIGPAVASPEELPPDASIRLRVDGERRQDSSIDQLLFSVPELVAEVTRYLTLEPGDLVATGTPPGVGPLSPGDRVEIEIEGIGTLRHGVDGE